MRSKPKYHIDPDVPKSLGFRLVVDGPRDSWEAGWSAVTNFTPAKIRPGTLSVRNEGF
jgi:hypothetical protein